MAYSPLPSRPRKQIRSRNKKLLTIFTGESNNTKAPRRPYAEPTKLSGEGYFHVLGDLSSPCDNDTEPLEQIPCHDCAKYDRTSCSDDEKNIAYECYYNEDDDMISRFESISPPKRRKSINVGANDTMAVATVLIQMKPMDEQIKRRVSFGTEHDQVFDISPCWKYENMEQSDLWWTNEELSQIRCDTKNLIAPCRSNSSSDTEVRIPPIPNEIRHYRGSFRQSHRKVMLHEELTSNEKDDLIVGLYHGYRGLEMYSPRIAYGRYKMMQETIASVVLFHRNAKQQQQLTENNRRKHISISNLFPDELDDYYDDIANAVQRHSEMLTVGCRMWAKVLGEAEKYAAMDSIPINQSKYGSCDNDQVTDSNNTVNVLQSEQIMI